MSHFTTIQTQIRDIDALSSACEELGCSLLPNAEARGYYTQSLEGDYVLRLKGPYDVALLRQPDQTYALSTDWWGGHVEREVGANFGRLLQLYGLHKATREAKRRGLLARRETLSNGAIRLVIGGFPS